MWKLPKQWWKKPPFLIVAGAIIFWSIVFCFKWADGRIDAYASRTSAILYQLSSDIQNLPEPSFIEAGKTSGNAAGVISKYGQTVADLRAADEKLDPPAFPNLLVFWRRNDVARVNTEAAESLGRAADDLQKTTDALKAARKFIEYAPMADLQGIGGADTSERLDRTKSGLLKSAEDLRNTDFEGAPAMAGLILPIAEQVPSLKKSTLPSWSAQVLKVQAEEINVLQTYWPKYVESASKSLSAVAAMSAGYQ